MWTCLSLEARSLSAQIPPYLQQSQKISQNHTAEDRYQKEDKAVNFADQKVVEKCNTGEKNCQT